MQCMYIRTWDAEVLRGVATSYKIGLQITKCILSLHQHHTILVSRGQTNPPPPFLYNDIIGRGGRIWRDLPTCKLCSVQAFLDTCEMLI